MLEQIVFTDINDKGPSFFTEFGGNLTFLSNNSAAGQAAEAYRGDVTDECGLEFAELSSFDNNDETEVQTNRININFTYDTSDDELDMDAVTADNNFAHAATTLKNKDEDTSDEKRARTKYGTLVEQDIPTGGGDDWLTLTYPDDASEGKVYLTGTGATVSTSTTVSGLMAFAGDEVSDITAYNALVVGGPAINEIAADLLGLTFPTYGESVPGLEEGAALIKVMANGNNMALVAYGWSAEDTQRAAKVLESYDQYTLTGTEVSVGGSTSSPTVVA